MDFIKIRDMITFENLRKTYGGVPVLEVTDLTIEKGSCMGWVGNNGAGKTTLFSLLLDLIQPSSGKVTINGIEVSASEDWKNHTAAFIDESFLIGYLTPEEYFAFVAQLRQSSPEATQALLDRFAPFFNESILGQKKYIRDLSKGNQKKVGIAAAFLGNPDLIILDEPFANLDPSTQIQLKKMIGQQQETHQTTFLISSHDLTHVTEICHRIALLENGKIVKDITTNPTTLKELEGYFTR